MWVEMGSMAQQNNATDNTDAIKNEAEPTQTGDRWEDHKGKRFTSEVTDDGIICHYDDGNTEGPFDTQEFEDSREYLNYLGGGN